MMRPEREIRLPDPRTDQDLYRAIMATLDSVRAGQLDPIHAYDAIMHSVMVWQRWAVR